MFALIAPMAHYTRSQAVARIADRTAKNIAVTSWSRPRPLSWKLFVRLLGIAHSKQCIKFEVSSSNSFEDMFDRMQKNCRVTWPRPRPLSGKLFVRLLDIPDRKLHTKFEVSSSSSFEILRFKRIGVTSLTFQGHVTSSVTWPFDSPYAISYW